MRFDRHVFGTTAALGETVGKYGLLQAARSIKVPVKLDELVTEGFKRRKKASGSRPRKLQRSANWVMIILSISYPG